MTLATWLLYVAAVLVLTVTPGPSVLMSVSTSVNLGARKALVAPAKNAEIGIEAIKHGTDAILAKGRSSA